MSMERHIADAEAEFIVYNVTPDFCIVGESVVPFDISQMGQDIQQPTRLDGDHDALKRTATFRRKRFILLGVPAKWHHEANIRRCRKSTFIPALRNSRHRDRRFTHAWSVTKALDIEGRNRIKAR